MYLSSRTVFLTLILGGSSVGLSGASLAAESLATGDHQHGLAVHELQLNAGEKWATDAPLRKAMGSLNDAMRAALPEIHEDRLGEASYVQLASLINDEVAFMIKHCKLTPEADAQLHLIIAQMLAGSDSMAGKAEGTRRDGAVKVMGALGSYAKYFADPAIESAQH